MDANKSNHDRPYVIKADPSSYLMFSIMLGTLIVLCMVVTIRDRSFWPGLLTISSIYITLMIWFSAFKIDISDREIIYHTLLSQSTIIFGNIYKIEIHIGAGRESIRESAFYRLVISEKGRTKNRPVMINMKPFKLQDLAFLVNYIIRNGQDVKADAACRKLAGRFSGLKPPLLM